MARDVGKPVRFGRGEVRGTVEMLRAIASRWQREAPPDAGRPMAVSRRPHGVVAIITPWNNPLYIPLGKIVPAVLYGNAVVWKPAPEALGLSERMMQLLTASGWPEDLVRHVGGGREAGEALMNQQSVAAVTLTGSSAAGYAAQGICGRRRIPLQAELGGNNAAIVMPDADLGRAAREIVAGAFEQAGQRCTANSRIVVHAGCSDALLELIVEEAGSLVWGDPAQETTQVGPVVSAGHRERVAGMIERALAHGVRALWPLGSKPPGRSLEGAWQPPVILCCEDGALEIVQEEVFGPVLVVQTARDWDEAIGLCNGVRQGLVASIFTESENTVADFLERAQAGILKVNQSTASAAVDAPFGGWKHSGLGPPEHGEFDRDFYTRPQTIYF
jgi:acyl-CoA reductase-like NAD-dependent aldehyde dehydrogenase